MVLEIRSSMDPVIRFYNNDEVSYYPPNKVIISIASFIMIAGLSLFCIPAYQYFKKEVGNDEFEKV